MRAFAQVAAVLRLHKQGKSLRWIVDETSLSLRTVRTIIEREHGRDRTTKARREKIEIDKFQRAHWKSQRRTGDALPKRFNEVIETGNALVTEAKGLGRGRWSNAKALTVAWWRDVRLLHYSRKSKGSVAKTQVCREFEPHLYRRHVAAIQRSEASRRFRGCGNIFPYPPGKFNGSGFAGVSS